MLSRFPLSEPQYVQVFEVVGRITETNALNLLGEIDKALAGGRAHLILDLSGVEYMNSSGLRELVNMLKYVTQKGGNLYIINPSDRVRDVLELVGLDTLFDLSPASSLVLSRFANDNRLMVPRQICYCA